MLTSLLKILIKILNIQRIFLATIWVIIGINTVFADDQTINLTISYKAVNFAGKSVKAIAVNNQIPGPTLHLKEGDEVTINVHNKLDKGTTIHWHGLLVPWNMDGVEGVSQEPIPPGSVFQYQFTLKQSGTYWYHAHAGFQEQQGLYGSIIIDPISPVPYNYTKDYVVVLSDWSNTSPEEIYANLKKEGDYYSPNFPLQPSLLRFIGDYIKSPHKKREQLIDDYQMMQQMRMSFYDFSDVAYDGFLLNGHPSTNPWNAPVKIGDIVRLRFINAGASTIFRVKIPNETMKAVHIQGNDIEPYEVEDFTVASAETFDVLVKIQKEKPYIIYAESSDTLGSVIGVLTPNPNQKIDYKVAPFPSPLPVTREMMLEMRAHDLQSESKESPEASQYQDRGSRMVMPEETQKETFQDIIEETPSSHPMNMSGMMRMDNSDQMENKIIPNDLLTKGTKYQNLKSLYKTNDPDKPVEVINMSLSGYMDRYIWFINGLPEYKSTPILIEPGKRYRLIFVNNSMMHHPMHIHGHFFILRNGYGEYDPFLHTIDVPPGATVVADFDADVSGQWFFHCHNLYHMMAGMSRIFKYTTFEQSILDLEKEDQQRPLVSHSNVNDSHPTFINHPMGHSSGLYTANFLELGEDPFHNIQKLSFKSLFGSDYNKLQLYSEDVEIKKGKIENADMDIFYWRLISEFWAIKGGINYFYRPSKIPYWQPGIGIEGLMPYFISLNARTYYHEGSVKLDAELARDTQITNNFFMRLDVRGIVASKTVNKAEIGRGFNQMIYKVRPFYCLTPELILFSEFEHNQNYGEQKRILLNNGESPHENTITFGVSLLF
ncbi:MAG TPA: multicopper oxidase domain-containing protein [Alphaproteobacteria bacterium]|nr:MAG: copper oxidase [Alphaproteobacteria bacterium 17-39-52]HQS84487.1 multicopper oxidase domain-containing protein [Alphaproteobacteria bacterium]HQS93672.1 multicopper oxidase domain-containing protein [Alphaproteobacteria bacterium]